MREALSEFDRSQETDSMTGLPGRSALIRLAQSVLARDQGATTMSAFMIVEFAAIRHVFQNAGFREGEEILRAASDRIRGCIGDQGRLGWNFNQFVVIAWDLADENTAVNLANRIVAVLQQPFETDGHLFYLYSNVGISLHPRPGSDGNDVAMVARQVNLATPREADGFRNEVRVFDQQLAEDISRRITMDRELRTAAARGELSLLYQPRVQIDSGKIVGAEALLRWDNRELGQVSPEVFAPLSEKTGHIFELTDWTLIQACREAVHWQQYSDSPIRVGINFSALMFDRPALHETVREAIEQTGLPPECLEIEITENAFLERKSDTVKTLEQIKSLGVKISLDDFGTGFSAMSYLGRFPLDCLKIDRAFVQDLPGSGVANGIAKSVAMLASACGLESVAEGMETQDQVIALRVLGCQFAQGYYFSPPVPGQRIRELLRDGRRLPAPAG